MKRIMFVLLVVLVLFSTAISVGAVDFKGSSLGDPSRSPVSNIENSQGEQPNECGGNIGGFAVSGKASG